MPPVLAGTSAVSRDKAKHKEADKKLRQQAALLELAHDAIFVRDMQSRILYWNRGAQSTYGFTSEEAIGHVTHELLKTQFPTPLNVIEQIMRGKEVWEGELVHARRDGAAITVASRWSLMRDENGVPESILEINRDITERKRAEAAISAERRKFNTILDSVPPYVCLLTPDYHVSFANHEFRQRFGDPDGRHCYEALFNRAKPCEACETYKVLEDGASRRWEWTGPDGRGYDVYDLPFTDTDGSKLILEMGIDITERSKAEQKLHRVNRTLQTLSECTEALMRATDETVMLQRVCDAAVRVGCYSMAWVGYAEHDEKKIVRPIAHAGFEEGYLKSLNICWADEERGRGPTGTAIRCGTVSVCNDMSADPRFLPWREDALGRGYGSSIALPLRSEKEVFGALMVYATEPGVFDSSAQRLLEELANNMSYAITTLRARAERNRAEVALQSERRRFEAVLDGLPALICLITPDHRVAFANKTFCDRFGNANGRKCHEYVFGDCAPCSFCEAFQVLETGYPHDWECPTLQGRLLHVYNMPFTDVDGSPLILEMNIDVTEQRRAEDALRQSTAELKEAQRVAQLGNWSMDVKTGEVKWSEELYRMLGLDPSQPALPYSKQEQIFTPESWTKLTDSVAETIRSGIPYELELQVTRPDGTRGWILARGEPLRDANGMVASLRGVSLDITNRKQTELALRKSEKQFSTLADFVPQFVWMCTPEGLNTYFNQRWFDYTGLSSAESYGKGWNTPFHPEDQAAAWNAWNQAVVTGETYRVESRLRAADGTYRWFLMRGIPLQDDGGKIIQWFGTCTDIDDLKQAEEEIRALNKELEERVLNRTAELQTILDTAPIGLAITNDPEARHIRGNTATEQMLGIPAGSEVSKSSPECAPYRTVRDGRELHWSELPMQRAARGEVVTGDVLEIVRVDGKTVSLYSCAAPLFDQNRKPRGAVGAFVDLTERRRQEEAMRQSEVRFRLLADSVPDLVWTCTPDGRCDYLNSRWVEYTGISEQELLGFEWVKQVHSEDRERVAAEWKKTLEQEVAFDSDFRIRSKEGVYRYFKTRGAAVRDANGRIWKWFGTNTDIEDLRQSQEALAEANKELEAFASSVSHDLRAPLRHISGFSKILTDDFAAELPAQAQLYLQRIHNGTRQMGLLVDDLLNLSRIGRHELHCRVTGLERVVAQVVADLQPEWEVRNVEWKLGKLPFADCDPALIKQVFQNLLSNALKFTRPREQAVIEVGQEQQGGVPVIFVRDNGVGFSMQYANKLFGVFQRLHRAEDFEGTGVGLATVQRIIQKHGGAVWASAELDKGATFYFTLLPSTQNSASNTH